MSIDNSYILKIKDLTKEFGEITALDNFNLEITSGKIIGLLGPNGSGKTTLFNTILGATVADSGEILIDDMKPGAKTKAIISYLPDENHYYQWMEVKDAVKFFATFYDDFDKNKALELIKTFKINMNEMVKSLSKGVSEQLRIILALSRKAKLFLLDEPLVGIDLVKREQILDLILNNFHTEGTILLSTHLIEDVERLFDEVCFISCGKNILYSDIENIRINRNMSLTDLYREVFKNEKYDEFGEI